MNSFFSGISTFLGTHYRFFLHCIVAIGILVSFAAVYVFLFTTAPVEVSSEQIGESVVKKESLSRVTAWLARKQQEGNVPLSVSNASFLIPPSQP